MKKSFLPEGYKAPAGSGSFMILEEGANRFRILDEAKIGWKGWKDDKSFARLGIDKNIEDDEVDEDNYGNKNVYHVWIFKVFDRKTESVKLLEIRQKTVMKAIQGLIEQEDWGDPSDYDITITQSKEGGKTKYSVTPHPKKALAPEVEEVVEASELDAADAFKEASEDDDADGLPTKKGGASRTGKKGKDF